MRIRTRIQFQIQGFDDQKLTKIYIWIFLSSKIAIFFYSLKDVQATGEAFNPQKRTSSTLKHENS